MRKSRAIIFGVVAVALVVAVLWFLQREPAASVSTSAPDPETTPSLGKPGVAAPARAPLGQRQPVAAPADPMRVLPRVRSAPSRDAPNGAFSGRVVSAATGAGVAAAEVTFATPGGAVSVTSEPTGAFEFVPRAPGSYQVAATHADGFLPFGPEWGKSPIVLTAGPGVRVSDLVIALTPAPELLGKVVGHGDVPVAGADVRVLVARARESVLFPLPDHFRTDARGEFRFQAPEDAVIEARHTTLGRGRATVDADAIAAKRVVVTLSPADEENPSRAGITGRVLAPDGSASTGAIVSVRSASSAWPKQFGARDGYEAVTDEAGRFTFSGLEAGLYDVTALSAGDAPARLFDVKAPASELLLKLGSGGRLIGTVVDDRGQPVPAFDAALQVLRGPLERLSYAQSRFVGAQGRFEFEGVAPGRYVLEILSAGFVVFERTIDFPEAQSELQTNVRLERGERLSGRVVEAGMNQPLSGARVSVEGAFTQSSLRPSYDALTDTAGQFAIEGVPAAGVTLNVSAAGHNSRVYPGAKPSVPVTVELTRLDPDAGHQIELVGIGAVLAARNDALVIGTVVPGGGAQAAGLAPGDGIVEIDQTPVVELGFSGSVQRIRGPEGSTVTLGVRKSGSTELVDVSVVRKRVSAG